VTSKIKRELRRRAAVEQVIGHLKAGHGPQLSLVPSGRRHQRRPCRLGYNFRRTMYWLCLLLRQIFAALTALQSVPA
jgi:IS5 family transposase